jgi:EmrB/QacA subfamily drug resistance transporter
MAFIDSSVANLALPALQAEFNATIMDLQWVVEAYALFLAALLLVGGALGDRFGRKRIYSIGIAIFALASVCCGLAPGVHQLIVARGVQGVGAALLVPGSLAIISASFAPGDRGKAIGIWSGFSVLTSALGPVIGGSLIEHVSWRAVFFLNVPLAAIALYLVYRHVPESSEGGNGRGLDGRGATLATLGLGALVYGLIEAGSGGLVNPAIVFALLTAVVLLLFFLYVEGRSENPMLPLSLFRSRNFSGANLLTLFLYAALSGGLFFFPLNLIQVQGYSTTAAGAAMLPFVLIMFLLSRWSGGLLARFGPRLPLIIGPVIAAAGFALFILPGIGGSYWQTFLPAIVVLGLGMAVSVAPLTTTVMNAVDSHHTGVASGTNNAVARTAGLLAVAVFGLVMSNTFNATLDRRLQTIDVPVEIRQAIDGQRVKLAGADIPAHAGAAMQSALKRAVNESFIAAFRRVMLIATLLALLSAVSAALVIRSDA